jgi:hypothetical protein
MKYTDEEYERDMIIGYLDDAEIAAWTPNQALVIAEERNRMAADALLLTILGG